jgi:alpha-L-fucosidase
MGDNEYPDYSMAVPWQTAASVFDETWGYRSWQVRGELQPKVEEKIESLIRVISRGGNYLLNIGPRGDGSVVAFERDLLKQVGRWVEVNSEAIYATEGNPFPHAFSWGEVTAKEDALYLFVKREYAGRKIDLAPIEGMISAVKMLSSGVEASFTSTGSERGLYTIEVPQLLSTASEAGVSLALWRRSTDHR